MEKFERKGYEGVKFFIGPEIEQTPAYGKKTLFVVGLQNTSTIEKLAKTNKISHIYLSANRSFDAVDKVGGVFTVGDTLAEDWAEQIQYLLDQGFMVSLDYPAHKHVYVLEILNEGIWQCRNFVPILSVPIPHVSTTSVNLTIKIDDTNFDATNPGVWCLNHREVTDSNRFTDWNEYGEDLILNVPDEPMKSKIVKVQVPVEEVEPALPISVMDTAEMYSGTTTVSIDSSDADSEPELVARKTVREAKAKAAK